MNFKAILILLCLAMSAVFARPTLLIIDSTGSMGESLNNGMTKLDAAKSAAKDIVQSANDEVGLMVYTDCDTGGDPNSGSVKVLVPFTSDKQQIISAIDSLTPQSETAISDAIKEASTYVSSTGKNAAVILLTDGEETCGTLDSATLSSTASSHGIQLINVVGFQLSSTAKTEMTGLAQSSGGHYYDANDTASLQQSMQQAYGSASGGGGSFCCLPTFLIFALVCGILIKGRI
jgi:Ca-activated chloride channel family protein